MSSIKQYFQSKKSYRETKEQHNKPVSSQDVIDKKDKNNLDQELVCDELPRDKNLNNFKDSI